MWQCDKSLEEMQQYAEQWLLPEKETARTEDHDSDGDSATEQEAEEIISNSQATEDVSDEGIEYTCIAGNFQGMKLPDFCGRN